MITNAQVPLSVHILVALTLLLAVASCGDNLSNDPDGGRSVEVTLLDIAPTGEDQVVITGTVTTTPRQVLRSVQLRGFLAENAGLNFERFKLTLTSQQFRAITPDCTGFPFDVEGRDHTFSANADPPGSLLKIDRITLAPLGAEDATFAPASGIVPVEVTVFGKPAGAVVSLDAVGGTLQGPNSGASVILADDGETNSARVLLVPTASGLSTVHVTAVHPLGCASRSNSIAVLGPPDISSSLPSSIVEDGLILRATPASTPTAHGNIEQCRLTFGTNVEVEGPVTASPIVSGEWQKYEPPFTETLEFLVTVTSSTPGPISLACQDEFGQTGALTITPEVEDSE